MHKNIDMIREAEHLQELKDNGWNKAAGVKIPTKSEAPAIVNLHVKPSHAADAKHNMQRTKKQDIIIKHVYIVLPMC
jgi:hypothetical protein